MYKEEKCLPSHKIKTILASSFAVAVLSLLTLLPINALFILCSAAIVAVIGFCVTRLHFGYVAFVCFINFAIYTIFSGSLLSSISSSLPLVLCGLSLGICLNLKLSVYKTLTIFTVSYLLCIVLNIKITEIFVSGQNAFVQTVEVIGNVLRESITTLYPEQAGANEIDSLVSEFTSMLLRISPSFIVIICISFALLCYYLFRRLCMMTKTDVSCFLSFSSWKAERFLSIPFFIILALYFFMPGESFLSDISLNISAVMSFIFFVLGLSLIEFKLEKKIKKSYIRKLILIVIVLSSFFMGFTFTVISTIGALDGLINYREKKFFNR